MTLISFVHFQGGIPQPLSTKLLRRHHGCLRKTVQHVSEGLLEPRMQDNIRTAGHAFDVELPTGGMEQGEQLCRPSADVLMRLPSRLSDWLPSLAQVWDRLVGSGFIFDVHVSSAGSN